MKTNKDFMLRKIAGESILVATGEATQRFNGMITLNEVELFVLYYYSTSSSRTTKMSIITLVEHVVI